MFKLFLACLASAASVHAAPDLIVTTAANATLTAGTYSYGTVQVQSGAILVISGSVQLTVASFQVQSGGLVDGDGGGYAGGIGAGGGPGAGSTYAGAGHGGAGGRGAVGGGGGTYDLDDMPTQAGSGGGRDAVNGGGPGGAALWVSSTSDVTIDGTVSVNGAGGPDDTVAGGGGAGGSIYLYGAIAGSGTLQAQGGGGGSGTNGGGGGGGGIILARTTAGSCPTLTLNAGGGGGGHGTINGYAGGGGAAHALCPDLVVTDGLSLTYGSSYAFNTITLGSGGALTLGPATTVTAGTFLQAAGSLTLDGVFNLGVYTYQSGSLALGPGESMNYPFSLTLPAGSGLTLGTNASLSVTGSLLAQPGSTGGFGDGSHLSVTGSFQNGGALGLGGASEIDCSDLIIPSGGSFNGTGNGFPHDSGPGAPPANLPPLDNAPIESGGGGGHGGAGGANSDGSNAGGLAYDAPTAPSQAGSGGRTDNFKPDQGGGGGAAVKFVVANGAALSGTVTVDGGGGGSSAGGGSGVGGGGGAGGSIYIVAADFWGNGSLSAQGWGGGGSNQPGGGGGGGLIYLDSTTGRSAVSASISLAKDVLGGGGYGNGGSAGQYGDDFLPVATLNDASVTLSPSGPVGLVLPVTLTKASASTVTVHFATANLSATAGVDYTAASGTLSFSPGQTVQDITITVLAQAVDQFPLSLAVSLSGAVNAQSMAFAVVTIVNPNPPSALSLNDVSIVAGVSGTANLVFTASLLSPSGKTISVSYATSDGAATAPRDYLAASRTLTFNPGTTSQAIAVPVVGSLIDKDPATFNLTLSSPVNVNLSKAVGVGTITEDPGATMPTISAYPVSVTSSAGTRTTAYLVVALSGPSEKAIQVDYQTLSGTAGSTNYRNVSGTLTFPGGTLSETIPVLVFANPAAEDPIAFYVGLTNAVNATMGVTEATCTIFDSVASTLSIGDAAVTVTDASGPTLTAVFPLTLSSASIYAATVNYATAPLTAIDGVDYVGGTGMAVFAPGQTAQDISITVLSPLVAKPALSFQVQLSGPVNLTLGGTTGTGTINNTVSCLASVSGATAIIGSAGSPAVADFVVSLSHPNSLTVTAAYNTVSGTAAPGTDYTASSGTVSFPPYSVTQTVSVPVVNRLMAGPALNFGLQLASATIAALGQATATAQILDTHPSPGLSVNSPTGAANLGALAFTVTLDQPSGLPVGVSYATVDGGATAPTDYLSASGTLDFAPGQLSQTVSVHLVPSAPPKNNATFSLQLSAPVNATLARAAGLGTILAAWAQSRLGKTVLGPVPATAGTPLCLYFADAPASTHWDIYTIDRQRVAALDYGAQYSQCWQTHGVAPGVYRVEVHVTYTDGVTETKAFKAMIKP